MTVETTEIADLIQAGRDDIIVTTTGTGWKTRIDIRNNPARQMDPNAKLDFLRIVREDVDYWKLYQLTHNEVIKGEATFSGALVGMIYRVVDDYFDTL